MSDLVAPLVDSPPLRRHGPPTLEFGDAPAANTDFVRSIDQGYWVRFLSVFFRLVTSATVASREVVVEFRDVQDQRFALYGAPVTVSANSTEDYAFNVNQPRAEWPVDSSIVVPLGGDLLVPGEDMRIHLVNGQTGDQLSRIRYRWEAFEAFTP